MFSIAVKKDYKIVELMKSFKNPTDLANQINFQQRDQSAGIQKP